MTSGAPWSVKGIDPKAREVAKDLARRSGMTLGEWLNRMILEDEAPEEITTQAYFQDRGSRPERSRPELVVDAGRSDGSRVAVALDRLSAGHGEPRRAPEAVAADTVMREAMARVEGAVHEARAENSRLAERLRKVEAEASGPRSVEALRSLEATLSKVAGHLYEGEGRTRETINAMEQRIDQIVASGAGDPAALIEEVVSRVDARLSDAEARTSEALVNLGQAFADLDSRMGAAEMGSTPDVERRIEALSATLSQRVDQVRDGIAQELQAAVEDSARRAEKITGEAIERMGREVLTITDSLNRQVQAAEHRSADAIEQVGGEVARIAEAMEARLGRSDTAHTEALERLGAEISRITDRLTERIGSSERRAAQAIDDVGEQVARVSDRLSQRQERTAEDFAERIRQSEERTARLLDEARAKIDRSLAQSHRREDGPAPAASMSEPIAEAAASPFGDDPFGAFGPAADEDALALQAFAAAEAPSPFEDRLAATAVSFDADEEELETPFGGAPNAPVFDAVDFEAADGFAPTTEADFVEQSMSAEADADEPVLAEPALDEPALEEPAPEQPQSAAGEIHAGAEELEPPVTEAADDLVAEVQEEPPPLSTREVIEQARAAARAAAGGDAKRAKGPAKIEKLPPKEGRSLFGGMGLRRRSAGSSLHTALLVAGGAACLSLGAASYLVADGEPGGGTPQRVADALAVFKSDQAGEVQGTEADTTPQIDGGRAAVALVPQSIVPAAPMAAGTPADAAAVASLYADALRAIEASEAGGLDKLRKAANLGYSPAQFYLAKLYSEGGAGLNKDPVEARRWTERSAEGGNRAAMHNLGIALAEGQGGPSNAALAAQWFRKAADLGMVDSQYNLGVLYERGRGVSENAAEAYKWYLIAARSRDEQALKNAGRIRAGLSPEARAIAERAAQDFRPVTPNPSAMAGEMGAGSQADVATAQRALSRLAYYQGPTDGAISPALTMAIAAYQRHEGMAATGTLDPATLSRLQVFTR